MQPYIEASSGFPAATMGLPPSQQQAYACEFGCNFSSTSWSMVVEHEKTCRLNPQRQQQQGIMRGPHVQTPATATSDVEMSMQLTQHPTELETQSLRKVISQRYKVRMEDVDVARVVPVGSDGQTLYEVGFRVRGSPLTASEQQDAAQASSLLEEANKEMAPSPPIHVVGPPKNPSASPPQNSTTQEPKRPVPEKSKPQDTNDFFANNQYDIDRTFKDLELRVVVVGGMHLPKQDVWGSCDPYCVIKFGTEEFKTHVLKNTMAPHWEEGGNFELYWIKDASQIPALQVEVWDWDRQSDNDIIGVGQVPANIVQQAMLLEDGHMTPYKVMMEMPEGEKAGGHVVGQDGMDMYIQLELVVFEKDTPEKVQLEVEKKFNADFKKWIWRPCSQNAYGAFLCIAMSEGLVQAIKQVGIMLSLTIIIQLIFATQIQLNIPELDAVKGLCRSEYSLWWASLTLYWFLMMDNVPHLVQSLVLVLFTREQDKAGRRTRVNVSMPSRIMIILIAILTESAAWGVQVNAGTRFILTAADPIAVVRSTVALMFIQGIDEAIFKTCSTPKLRRMMGDYTYRIMWLQIFGNCANEQGVFRFKNIYSQYFHMPLMGVVGFMQILVVRLYLSKQCPSDITVFGSGTVPEGGL
eukprot:Tamp_08108.p1 GENE.Tamp_08108~~Tamp_08108.p1  ORF type:complete len:688 (-),score=86.46 Tamp_08108:317-2224(-)